MAFSPRLQSWASPDMDELLNTVPQTYCDSFLSEDFWREDVLGTGMGVHFDVDAFLDLDMLTDTTEASQVLDTDKTSDALSDQTATTTMGSLQAAANDHYRDRLAITDGASVNTPGRDERSVSLEANQQGAWEVRDELVMGPSDAEMTGASPPSLATAQNASHEVISPGTSRETTPDLQHEVMLALQPANMETSKATLDSPGHAGDAETVNSSGSDPGSPPVELPMVDEAQATLVDDSQVVRCMIFLCGMVNASTRQAQAASPPCSIDEPSQDTAPLSVSTSAQSAGPDNVPIRTNGITHNAPNVEMTAPERTAVQAVVRESADQCGAVLAEVSDEGSVKLGDGGRSTLGGQEPCAVETLDVEIQDDSPPWSEEVEAEQGTGMARCSPSNGLGNPIVLDDEDLPDRPSSHRASAGNKSRQFADLTRPGPLNEPSVSAVRSNRGKRKFGDRIPWASPGFHQQAACELDSAWLATQACWGELEPLVEQATGFSLRFDVAVVRYKGQMQRTSHETEERKMSPRFASQLHGSWSKVEKALERSRRPANERLRGSFSRFRQSLEQLVEQAELFDCIQTRPVDQSDDQDESYSPKAKRRSKASLWKQNRDG